MASNQNKTQPEPVSLRSDDSRDMPPDFREPGPYLLISLRSNDSRDMPPDFREPGPYSRKPVSLRSNDSRDMPPDFREPGPYLEELSLEGKPWDDLDDIFVRLEKDILMFVKQELQHLQRLLSSEPPESRSETEEEQSSRDAVLNITIDFLRRKMKKEQLAQRLWDKSTNCARSELKHDLQLRSHSVFEGVAKAGNSTPLQQIYTELYITEGGTSEVNQEHEVRHIQTLSWKPAEATVACEDIFKGPPRADPPIRTVLTKGVAGIGKTVLTQKFILDWAEGRTNQDVQLLFPFTFRELNMLRDRSYSLVELLHFFFRGTKGLSSFEDFQVLFIFDGLDECRLPLDFSRTRVLTEPTESASVEVLMVNLIKGSLLPSARLWITTRPAAASQIPAECVSMVTEVRGFTDPQKEQYFRKRFRDEQQATAVISHIKRIRTLHIMCNIPIFSWILSTVLQKILELTEKPELPKTLTEMFVHFLVVQVKVKKIKYEGGSGADPHWSPETREMVQSLGKLAFEQLQKGNLIFYESDLSECGLDTAAASVYSGVFTQIFREEPGLYQDKVYCFIHLSVQEFLAALHVHQTFFSSGENLLSSHSSDSPRTAFHPRHKLMATLFFDSDSDSDSNSDLEMSYLDPTLDPSSAAAQAFYRSAVDQALQSPNGHLDLFLRFLLGLSLPTNQRLLQGLLPSESTSSQINQRTVEYIKQKLDRSLSAERSLNLLHCLNELNDHSLLELVQKRMRSNFSSPCEWSALVFHLLSLNTDLQEFDLKSYQASEATLLRLTPLIKASSNALLSGCDLSPRSCEALASVLSSSSSLTHLDLSNNDLQDIGVELLCEGLQSAPCRLQTLRLSGCLVTERGGASLASVVSSACSHLRELDLSYNHPGPSAELLIALQEQPDCTLDSLRLEPKGEKWMVPGLRKYFRQLCLDPNTAQHGLQLSENNRKVSRSFRRRPSMFGLVRMMSSLESYVLSSTGLTGRCYWEVEWKFEKEFESLRHDFIMGLRVNRRFRIEIIVGYRGSEAQSMGRRSRGYSEFWSLRVSAKGFSAHHNGTQTPVSSFPRPFPARVAVFLDYEAGCLSFYQVLPDGELSHLHTFNSTFTEPLFPGFKLDLGTSVSLCDSREMGFHIESFRHILG